MPSAVKSGLSCWENAPTESFFNSLKNERAHGVSYATRNEAMSDLFQYIAVFYNRSRRHSTLGYLSPTTFLQNWIERQNQQKMAHENDQLEGGKRRAPHYCDTVE